jgi:hypothetical protein
MTMVTAKKTTGAVSANSIVDAPRPQRSRRRKNDFHW